MGAIWRHGPHQSALNLTTNSWSTSAAGAIVVHEEGAARGHARLRGRTLRFFLGRIGLGRLLLGRGSQHRLVFLVLLILLVILPCLAFVVI